MSNLKAFLRENVEVVQNEFIIVSDRFKDDKGEPVSWEVRPLSEDEVDSLRKSCTKRVKSKNRGAREEVVDTDLLGAKLITASVVSPPLKNEELQKSWGVVGAEALVRKMLLFGEYASLSAKIYELSGIDNDFDEDVDDAKN